MPTCIWCKIARWFEFCLDYEEEWRSVNSPDSSPLLLPDSSQYAPLSKFKTAHFENILKDCAPKPLTAQAGGDGIIGLSLTFAVWYGFNAAYNVFNQFVKADMQFPWAMACMQLVFGLFYVVPLWALKLRPAPHLSLGDIISLLPIAFVNALGHAMTVCALFEKGGGSFTHVIKAAEPVVTTIMNIIMQGTMPAPLTALSLLPVTYGVAYASTKGNLNPDVMAKELTTKAAKMAMTSNIAFSVRSIYRREIDANFRTRTNLDPANEHAVTVILSLILLLPICLYMEGFETLYTAFANITDKSTFWKNAGICSICWYLYNEMQNKVLGSLGAVPTAVGNTGKRVAIFAALYFFTKGETFPMPKVIGCAIAIAGCLSFAIFDSKKI